MRHRLRRLPRYCRPNDDLGRVPLSANSASIPTSKSHPSTISLHGIELHRLTEAQSIDVVMARLNSGDGGWMVTANLDHLRRLVLDPTYKELCAPADLMVADGMPLVWASRLQRTPLPERVAGSSLIWALTRAAAEREKSVFLLGGAPGSADRAAATFKAALQTLRVAGTHCPQQGFESDPVAMDDMIERLISCRPDIVFVALGSPKQERLISQLRILLPNAWWIGVGISFSFVCGDIKRAPRWMQVSGLEWFHRLMQEPRRLARRYLVDDLPFIFRLMWSAARNRKDRETVG
jgi:N-acetylglucosaminyldiphosphoundecaprenol N-acetyl-beta-D-mannosaminyltransferase